MQSNLQRKPSPLPRRPPSRHTLQPALRRPAEGHSRVAEPRPRLPPRVLLVYQDIHPGQPFAITVYGITGRNLESAWPIHWLQAVASCLSRSIQTFGENHVPDFILPAFSPAQLLADPLQCSHALQVSAGPHKLLGCPRHASPSARPVTLRYTVSRSPSSPLPFNYASQRRTAGSKATIKSTVFAFIAETTPTNLCGYNASWQQQSETAGAPHAPSPEGANTPRPSPVFRSHPCQSPPLSSSPKRLPQSPDSSTIGRHSSKRQAMKSTRTPRQRTGLGRSPAGQPPQEASATPEDTPWHPPDTSPSTYRYRHAPGEPFTWPGQAP